MTESDVMTPDEKKYHPRLLLLDEFDGEIDSKLKFHKSLHSYREESDVIDVSEWTFNHNHFGPTDEGLSKNFLSLDKLDLVVIEKEDGAYLYKQTEKGSRVARGIRRGLSVLKGEEMEQRQQTLKQVAKLNKDRSGSEIAADLTEEMQEPYGIDQ